MIDIFSNTNILLIFAIMWVLPWKGYALWLSARKGQKWWFIILLVINTLAILEIIYIFLIAKKRRVPKEDSDSLL
ncbi:hypothetical protein COT82_00400 [Candidatus Campbellbacteria bacterium CG10_big_fil_rev_8_21_14_0_10_35_52]|uniref:DUF5652 domain-containing protein n=1 Tax=Candidatus Campbellbacteria bacterium CG10_big_fil_rev_8_21_14_0_10_35_52 TaxID=1974527 RepID=A0A2M6WW34_9BACT|nr:MAG: hypothetical protein COT82_00400 [Candidatus Campbellbacteria bacterium CG10_big_fil_rev_8_21_14_0_10_35_52]